MSMPVQTVHLPVTAYDPDTPKYTYLNAYLVTGFQVVQPLALGANGCLGLYTFTFIIGNRKIVFNRSWGTRLGSDR